MEQVVGNLNRYRKKKMAKKNLFLSFKRNSIGILSLVILSGCMTNAHVIETRLGLLEGVTKEARGGKLFHAYYGVRYAKPPIGNLRFEPPVAADPWTGIFNATERPEPCPQLEQKTKMYIGVEDCLHLIIYTPTDLKPGSNVPVIIYILGGVFRYGNALREGPEFLMSRDVIIVMVTYRIGALGLFTTGDTVIPGNMALKDQTLAMKWTNENIYEFGGDLDRITLHGQSSGATSVHLHTLSPLSKQYFHRVILQSGLATSPQSFRNSDEGKEVSHTLAAKVNCTTNSSELLKKCLQGKTARELVESAEKIYIWGDLEPSAVFRPVVEDKRVENAFLNENPLDALYVSESKPMLIGMTSDEAAAYVDSYAPGIAAVKLCLPTQKLGGTTLFSVHQKLKNIILEPFSAILLKEKFYRKKDYHSKHGSDILNVNTNLLLPLIGCYLSNSKPSYLNFITKTVKTHFFGEEDVNNATEITDIALVKILSGIMHGYGFIDVVEKYRGSKYAYLFDYRYIGGFSYSMGGPGGRFLGVAHSDEMPMIFNQPNLTGITDEDYAFGDEMITRWINFVYSGNPNIPFPINVDVFGSWSPISSSRIEFLRITNGGAMEKDYFLETYGIWRRFPIFSKYR